MCSATAAAQDVLTDVLRAGAQQLLAYPRFGTLDGGLTSLVGSRWSSEQVGGGRGDLQIGNYFRVGGPNCSSTAMKFRAVRSVQPNSARSQGPNFPCGRASLTSTKSLPTAMMSSAMATRTCSKRRYDYGFREPERKRKT